MWAKENGLSRTITYKFDNYSRCLFYLIKLFAWNIEKLKSRIGQQKINYIDIRQCVVTRSTNYVGEIEEIKMMTANASSIFFNMPPSDYYLFLTFTIFPRKEYDSFFETKPMEFYSRRINKLKKSEIIIKNKLKIIFLFNKNLIKTQIHFKMT